MAEIALKRPIYLVLTQASSYPYTLPDQSTGLTIVNTGTGVLTITLGNGIVITIPANTAFDDYFLPFKTITAAGSTAFQIGVK
jgi:hypothetical protein